MAEMTMLSMAVMAANKKSRSFSEAAAGRKDLYLTEGPAEEADVIYLPDYSSLDFRQVRELLTVGKHILFGTMGAADAGSLNALAQTAAEHGAVLLDHIHLAFNPCMASLKTALTCLGPIYRIRLYSCEYAFCCKGVCTVPVRPFTHIPQGGALFQRGYDCIYPPCASLRHTGTAGYPDDIHGKWNGCSRNCQGNSRQRPGGDRLFQDIRKPYSKPYRGRRGTPANP